MMKQTKVLKITALQAICWKDDKNGKYMLFCKKNINKITLKSHFKNNLL